MGGHGGLNILPQKKWNVYNYDNRDIVEKDKKIHAKKVRTKFQQQRQQMLQQKIQVLKDKVQGKSQQKIQQKDSLIRSELKRLNQQNKHVNLFQHEEQILLNRQILQCQKLKQKQWLKDKNMDYSSKFLGTYNNQDKQPWYLKEKKQQNSKFKKNSYQMDFIVDQMQRQLKNKKTEQNIKYNQQFINQCSFQRERSREQKIHFLIQKQMKVSQKIKIQPAEQSTNKILQVISLGKDNEDLEQLRVKRLKRQEKQRKKTQELMNKLKRKTD